MVLFHALFYFRISLVPLRVTEELPLSSYALIHFLGILAAALILPNLIAPARKPESIVAPKRVLLPLPVRAAGVILLFLLCQFAATPGMPETVAGIPFLYISVFFFGTLCPLTYGQFYAVVPPGRQGIWVGVSHSVGSLVAAAANAVGTHCLALDPGFPYITTYARSIEFLLVLPIVVLSIANAFNTHFQGQPRAPFFFADSPRQRRLNLGLLIAAIFVFCMICELNGIQFFPNIRPNQIEQYFLPALVVLAPIVGHLLDKYPVASFTPIMMVCAVFFMLTPASLASPHVFPAFTSIDLGVLIAQYITSLVLAVTIARLLRPGYAYFFILSLIYSLQIANVACGEGYIRNRLDFDRGFLILACILAVMLFYGLIKSVSLSTEAGVAEPPPVPSAYPATSTAYSGLIHACSGLAITEVVRHNGASAAPAASAASIAPAAVPAFATESALSETDRVEDLHEELDHFYHRRETFTASSQALRPDGLFQKMELTPRESDTAWLLIQGLTNREIADIMGISEHTVANHVKQVLRKFSVPSRKSFMAMFIGNREAVMPTHAFGGERSV